MSPIQSKCNNSQSPYKGILHYCGFAIFLQIKSQYSTICHYCPLELLKVEYLILYSKKGSLTQNLKIQPTTFTQSLCLTKPNLLRCYFKSTQSRVFSTLFQKGRLTQNLKIHPTIFTQSPESEKLCSVVALLYRKFLHQRIQLLKTLRLARKLSFQTIQRLSGQTRNGPDDLETVWTIQRLSR